MLINRLFIFTRFVGYTLFKSNDMTYTVSVSVLVIVGVAMLVSCCRRGDGDDDE